MGRRHGIIREDQTKIILAENWIIRVGILARIGIGGNKIRVGRMQALRPAVIRAGGIQAGVNPGGRHASPSPRAIMVRAAAEGRNDNQSPVTYGAGKGTRAKGKSEDQSSTFLDQTTPQGNEELSSLWTTEVLTVVRKIADEKLTACGEPTLPNLDVSRVCLNIIGSE